MALLKGQVKYSLRYRDNERHAQLTFLGLGRGYLLRMLYSDDFFQLILAPRS